MTSPSESTETPATEFAAAESRALLKRPLKKAVWDLKVTMLETALRKTRYNQKKAARMLGLTYHQFRGLYRQYQAVSQSNTAKTLSEK